MDGNGQVVRTLHDSCAGASIPAVHGESDMPVPGDVDSEVVAGLEGEGTGRRAVLVDQCLSERARQQRKPDVRERAVVDDCTGRARRDQPEIDPGHGREPEYRANIGTGSGCCDT